MLDGAVRRCRDLMVQGLNAIPGIRCPMPRSAFYTFPNIQAFDRSAAELAGHLLKEAGVREEHPALTAVSPGSDASWRRRSYLSGIQIPEAPCSLSSAT